MDASKESGLILKIARLDDTDIINYILDLYGDLGKLKAKIIELEERGDSAQTPKIDPSLRISDDSRLYNVGDRKIASIAIKYEEVLSKKHSLTAIRESMVALLDMELEKLSQWREGFLEKLPPKQSN